MKQQPAPRLRDNIGSLLARLDRKTVGVALAQFVHVPLRHLVQRDPDRRCHACHIPHNVAQLLHHLVVNQWLSVEEVFFQHVGRLTGFTGQTERHVRELIGLRAGANGAGGELLILVKCHGNLCGPGEVAASDRVEFTVRIESGDPIPFFTPLKLRMPIVTLVVGGLLSLLGILGYVLGATHSLTALIPLAFGVLLESCGALALQPRFRKHAMHGAALLALLGVVGSAMGFVSFLRLITGGPVARPFAAQMQAAMFLICLIFLGLCVRSFRAARAAREAAGIA